MAKIRTLGGQVENFPMEDHDLKAPRPTKKKLHCGQCHARPFTGNEQEGTNHVGCPVSPRGRYTQCA